MTTDTDRFLEAFRSRDRRFDGRFFVGVRTTGIYCRPICRARAPKPQNVRFYPCAAAAEEAGFRPCRRCRPETAPGTPAWNGSSTTVCRALRLIRDGAMDGHGVGELAARLGVGERHLRRLFAQHLGASPLAVARTRRVHFARRLIDETLLPMIRVAEGAGFSSVRQFNEEIRRTFGASPTQLRQGSRNSHDVDAGVLALRLPYRPPLDWKLFVDYFEPRAIPGVESVAGDIYRRTVCIEGKAGWIEVEHVPDASHLLLRSFVPSAPELIRSVERVRRIFDLGAAPDSIQEHLGKDPRLRRLVRRRPGLRVPGSWDPFELGVRAILGQQVSVRGATTLAGRLVEAFGRPLSGDAPTGLTHLFPRPDDLAEADIGPLGMPEKRAEAIRTLSREVACGRLDLAVSPGLSEAVERLASLPGLGPWTAAYIAMRGFGEPDAFPAEDLGVRKALAVGERLPTRKETLEIAEAWRPWRAYAVLHLWMNEPGPVKRTASRRKHHADRDRVRGDTGRAPRAGRR